MHNKVNLKLVFEARSRLGSKACEMSMSMWDAKVQRDLWGKTGRGLLVRTRSKEPRGKVGRERIQRRGGFSFQEGERRWGHREAL